MIESALFKWLDSFPHLTLKENVKLRELSDLLRELLSAKEDGYLPGAGFTKVVKTGLWGKMGLKFIYRPVLCK